MKIQIDDVVREATQDEIELIERLRKDSRRPESTSDTPAESE
jgi:hypothetical protein